MGLGMNPITHIQMSEQDFQAADPDSLIEGMIDKIYSSQESTEMDGGNIDSGIFKMYGIKDS